jgi:hypothetical protein
MSERLFQRHSSFAGPKTLAMLSCALALLAAQPWTSRAEPMARPATVRTEGTQTVASAILAVETQSIRAPAMQSAAAAVARREAARVEAQAHLQAAWTILHHLITTQLFGKAAPQFFLDTLDVAHFAPLPFDIATTLKLAGKIRLTRLDAPPMPTERLFAIAHCLLAPPC